MSREEKMEKLLQKESYNFDDLIQVTKFLRGENGCPWDKEQTHKSIRNNFIEETYEVVEAIDTENRELLCEELGDVMFQVVFHSEMSEEAGGFNINDVSDGICKKLISRHPHVFGDIKSDTSEDVLKRWEAIKNQEKGRETVTERVTSVPRMLPALIRAQKVGKRASCLDFKDAEETLNKISEELVEVSNAVESGDQSAVFEEIGDLLLAITCLCRKEGVDAEQALYSSTDKFIKRLSQVENTLLEQGKDINGCEVGEIRQIWIENKEKNTKN